MKKMALVIVVLASLGIAYKLPSLKTKSWEKEVDALAISYRVYESQICPNREILSKIRLDYIKTIDPSNMDKLIWTNNNFDSRFMSTCLNSSPHRGVY